MKIAFQGEPGANSHIAIVEAYPDAEPLPCPTFEDALAAIASGEAELGMIPIENSIAGRVADIHNLLPASGLHIIGETFLPIHFQLLAIPGATLGRLHAKTAVIDRSVVFIGSMNLDPRSASRNTELGVIIESPEFAREVLRVIHISKLQSAYRLQFGPDGQSLEWLTMDDDGEVILDVEPDTTFLLRLQNVLFSPFVPEQEL